VSKVIVQSPIAFGKAREPKYAQPIAHRQNYSFLFFQMLISKDLVGSYYNLGKESFGGFPTYRTIAPIQRASLYIKSCKRKGFGGGEAGETFSFARKKTAPE
jgi:hypothetical protein